MERANPKSSRRSRRDSGQAAVEAALTLPLVLFMFLGSIQMFMMLQARILAQVAISRAVRAGSLNHGDCNAMRDAAIATLLPVIPHTTVGGVTLTSDSGQGAAQLFGVRRGNRYADGSPLHTGQIVQLVRDSPLLNDLQDTVTEDNRFNQPDGAVHRLTARMIFWYHLRIPFADWVLSRMFLAHFAIQNYTNANPLIVAEAQTNWNENQALGLAGEDWGLRGKPDENLRDWTLSGRYLFPIRVAASMRMMSPPRQNLFGVRACPL